MKIFVRWIGPLLLILASFLTPMTAFAQGTEPPIPAAPGSGIYVLDTLEWLNPEQEKEINGIVSKLDSDQLAEIAVVTLDDCGSDTQKFRNDLFRTWGIGHADDNDGLLLLVCWYGGDKAQRKFEQEVGYGMEGTIPDLMTSKVAQTYFVPAFSTGAEDSEVIWTGKAGDALVTMVKSYDGIIRGSIPPELIDKPVDGSDLIFWLIIIVVAIIVLLFLLAWLGVDLGGSGGGSSSSSSSSWSSSSSDSGSSFGGGSSGGGGSSSSF
jgi:uncharacterized protein